MVTTKHLKTRDEELKINIDSQLGGRPEKKLNSSKNTDFMNNNSLRLSDRGWNKAAISSKKINDKQNFGFNSFIGSGNTPQDLKMQQRKKARNGFASGK